MPIQGKSRAYCAQDARKTLLEIGEYAEVRNRRTGHTSADVPRLIAEVRREKATRCQPNRAK